MEYQNCRSYRGPVKAVILDWAGTAVDYGSFAPTAVFLRLFESRGVSITPDDARSGMGLMKKDHLRTIFARDSVATAWREVNGADFTEKDIDNLFNDFVSMQTRVLAEYAEPIPGLLGVVQWLREHDIKIGSTTGYIRSMMAVLAPEAARHGYSPDCIVCPDDVPAGRPYPWMCYQNCTQLGVYPMEAVVKVGDTNPDIGEGLNAGMWTIGISMTGNFLGMSESQVNSLADDDRENTLARISNKLYEAGAHKVIDGIWNLPKVIDEISLRLANGERP